MNNTTNRFRIICDIAGKEVVSLGEEFNAWILGVSEPSPRLPEPRALYSFDPEFGQLLQERPPTDEALSKVLLMTRIEHMSKDAFWAVIRRPTPFLDQFNDAVVGLAHLPEDVDVVVYNYGLMREKEARIRDTSEHNDPGDTLVDQLMKTDMGPASPVFAVIPFSTCP